MAVKSNVLTHFEDDVSEDKKKLINDNLKSKPLIFEPKDIRYIFIDKEIERKNVIEMIRDAKFEKYSQDQVEILCSKIISYEQFEKNV